ncbi:hypothetical protein BV20DRAFT_704570 [Pilatotrama ljubarskyi]|nr:hypothetical protein BV20DRAFT_704570 [Pilatotrama ljubarskyi]
MRWLAIPSVCRRWYWIAATTPELWRSLYAVSRRLNYMRTCLVRSKDLTIGVVIGYSSMVPTALRLVWPHIRRIRHMKLSVARGGPRVLDAILETAIPALEALDVFVSKTFTDISEEEMQFHPERFPRLSELCVVGVHLLPSAVLRQLKVLSIHDWFGLMPGLTYYGLTTVLRELTNVEELALCDIICRSFESPPDPSITPRIVLPKLRAIKLDSLTSVMKHILSILSIPPSSYIVIRRAADAATESTDELSAQGIRIVLPADRAGLPILSRITSVWVKLLNNFEHRIQGTAPHTEHGENGGGFSCSLEMPEDYDGPPLLLDDFLDVFHDAPLKFLHVTVDVNLVTCIDWRSALAPFPTLRELIVSGTHEDGATDPIFSALDPDNAPEGTPSEQHVVCPRLQTLRIEGFGLAADALLLEARRCLDRRRDVLGDPEALADLSFSIHPDGETEA